MLYGNIISQLIYDVKLFYQFDNAISICIAYHILIIRKGLEGMVADRIKRLRELHSWTQSELSKKLGVTRSCVNAWEMGISVPSTQFIVELSALFKVSTDYLLGVNGSVHATLEGLNEEDIQIVHNLIKHLREKNQK